MEPLDRLVIREVLRRAHEYPADNWDYLRFGTDAFIDILAHATNLQWLHDSFADEVSRRLLVDLLAYRILGYSHVKLPLNTESFWADYTSIDAVSPNN